MILSRRAFVASALAASTPSRLIAGPRRFRAADTQAEDYPTVRALVELDRYVRDATSDRHGFEIFPSRLLGEERDTIEQTRAGAIDLARANVTLLAGFAPLANVLAMPYLFRSTDHLHAVLDGPIGDEILGSFRQHGLVGLAFYESGMRAIYNGRRPVRAPVDLAGLRLQVPESDLMVEILEAMGATAVPMSYGQVGPAIRTGIIDGAEGDWVSFVTSGQALAARYVSETRHVLAPDVLVMSRNTWDSLLPEDKVVFHEAARRSAASLRAEFRVVEAASRRRGLDLGVVPADGVDLAAFEAATHDTREGFLTDSTARALHERIRAIG